MVLNPNSGLQKYLLLSALLTKPVADVNTVYTTKVRSIKDLLQHCKMEQPASLLVFTGLLLAGVRASDTRCSDKGQ